MRTIAAAVAVLLALAAATACDAGGNGRGGDVTPPPGEVPGSNHALGSEQAAVLLVEYADFQ